LEDAYEGVDEVYHSAALVSFDAKDKEKMMKVTRDSLSNYKFNSRTKTYESNNLEAKTTKKAIIHGTLAGISTGLLGLAWAGVILLLVMFEKVKTIVR